MALPPWLLDLRREEIVDRVRADPRTTGDALLGVSRDRIFSEVIGGGQTDFDAPWEHLSSDDKALLYAYFNQPRHLEELVHAFTQMHGTSGIQSPVVIDLGCGPFTGGLALGSVLGPESQFTYIGVDCASSMHRLGERIATEAVRRGKIACKIRHWASDPASAPWTEPLRWSHVVVIVSYLLASPTADAVDLVAQLNQVLERVGRGPVTLLYTNSCAERPNRNFADFRDGLQICGFNMVIDEIGTVNAERWGGSRTHTLRYALFQRQLRNILPLGG